MKRASLKRTSFLRRGHLKKIGPKQNEWRKFRDQKLERDKDSVHGYVACEGYKIGLPECGAFSASPDLHHIIGRDAAPELYYDEKNLVWLTRTCHKKAHQ